MIDIPLKPVPSAQWQERYDSLSRNAWLERKTDRGRRLNEHFTYLKKYAPEILNTDDAVVLGGPAGNVIQRGLVIDVGPGPGELLEIARSYGYRALGVDAANGNGGMGDEYLDMCRLMTERQDLNVEYVGFESWVLEHHAAINETAALINFRGSIEQAFHRHMMGDAHHLHHDCRKLEWSMTAWLREVMSAAFLQMQRLLRVGGHILIVANGSKDDSEYDDLVRSCAEQAACKETGSLKLVMQSGLLIHKWVKVGP